MASIAATLRAEAERRSMAAVRGRETGPCAVCGAPVERGTKALPRECCPGCRDARNFVNAAVRSLERLDADRRRRARRLLIAAANRLAKGWARGADGRFVGVGR